MGKTVTKNGRQYKRLNLYIEDEKTAQWVAEQKNPHASVSQIIKIYANTHTSKDFFENLVEEKINQEIGQVNNANNNQPIKHKNATTDNNTINKQSVESHSKPTESSSEEQSNVRKQFKPENPTAPNLADLMNDKKMG